jgi:hypothetical protein
MLHEIQGGCAAFAAFEVMYGVVSLTLGLLPTRKGITEFSKLLGKKGYIHAQFILRI